MAVNFIYGLQETKLVFIDGMAKPWQFEEIIPILFVIMLGFIALYPLVEFFMITNDESRTPTEVHRKLKNIINKWKKPWRYFRALFFYVIIVWGPPLLLWELAILVDLRAKWGYMFTELTLFGFIFFAYIMLGAIVYLAYYENISKASFIARSRTYKKNKEYKMGFRNRIFINFLVIIAIISLISTLYSLIKNLPTLWGNPPELSTSYLDMERGIIETLIKTLLLQAGASSELMEKYYLFINLLPLDFLLFFVSTIGFGLLGFYTKFWNKEKLDRSQIFWFASYLMCGLCFVIFLSLITTYPWVLPDLGIIEMSDPTFQSIIVFFFGPSFVITQFILVGFFIYHIFFNKSLRNEIEKDIQGYLIERDEKRAKKITEKLKKKEEKRQKHKKNK
ncbi:MAG: hypothetical protein GF364_05830 [Candidatus Lokiarchaeota archaeon]|nr:hypothetical protein [Candidatus Lokiarchaeota archaeon]